ncbi:MAG: thioglycine synthase [Blastocatellia bacterium]|jgi:ribosomal protein S12 methylthiotransferase accessory factor|nr:thioglycine synthase [Blastocatellia bacterium]
MTISKPLPVCPVQASNWRRYHYSHLLPIAEREARSLGAVRPSDLAGLDELETPCWQVVRPTALDISGNVTVLTGKGWDDEQASLGAYMEFLERHWAERSEVPYIIARPSELTGKNEWFIPPVVMPLPLGVPDPQDEALAWISGTTLQGQHIWVPAHDVLCPFVPPAGAGNPPIWRSNGLASGGHLTEAVLYGLLEVIERDAMAVAELARVGTTVDLSDFPSGPVRKLMQRLPALSIHLEVKHIPAIGGVHVFAAFLDDREAGNPLRLVGGHSAHIDPLLAIEDAILEAVQTRAVLIAGSREDLQRHEAFAALGYEAARREVGWWFDATEARMTAPSAPLPLPADLAEVVYQIGEELRLGKFYPVVFIQLSPPDAEIVVVRVVVPTCSEISHDTLRPGRRILAGHTVATP